MYFGSESLGKRVNIFSYMQFSDDAEMLLMLKFSEGNLSLKSSVFISQPYHGFKMMTDDKKGRKLLKPFLGLTGLGLVE